MARKTGFYIISLAHLARSHRNATEMHFAVGRPPPHAHVSHLSSLVRNFFRLTNAMIDLGENKDADVPCSCTGCPTGNGGKVSNS